MRRRAKDPSRGSLGPYPPQKRSWRWAQELCGAQTRGHTPLKNGHGDGLRNYAESGTEPAVEKTIKAGISPGNHMNEFPGVVVEAVMLKSKYEASLEMMSINGPLEFDLNRIENNIKRKTKSMMDLSISDFSFVDETGVKYKIRLVSESYTWRNKS